MVYEPIGLLVIVVLLFVIAALVKYLVSASAGEWGFREGWAA